MAKIVTNMTATLRRRGPDGQGIWVDSSSRVAFGHRRLSIVDLSEAGSQPMASASGRFFITLNGEIYNHRELREELDRAGAAPNWRGHSDTEVFLAAIEYWGIDAALQRAVGMFALGLWDRQTRQLHLARDRFGEKPLYYGWSKGRFLFASELKAICAVPGFERTVDRDALALLTRYLGVPAPLSIFRHIYKLEPGCILTVCDTVPINPPGIALQSGMTYDSISIRRWWSLQASAIAGIDDRFTDETEALDEVQAKVINSVGLMSQADVPTGVFLSGGVDSSLIAAIMQKQSYQRIQSFTLGFDDPQYDESESARTVADYLGTEHHELFATQNDFEAVVLDLPSIYDEPFADSSQIPTHLVSRAARERVTVALTGDGADELFGGYERYVWAPAIWRQASWLPVGLRQNIARNIARVPAGVIDAMLHNVNMDRISHKVHKVSNAIETATTFDEFYDGLISEWRSPHLVLGQSAISPYDVHGASPLLERASNAERIMFADTMLYLPTDILCKVDRAGMASSLETRAPFLDHRIADTAWRLPMHMKIRGRQGKWALREILYRHVPRALVDRPKSGFGVPVGQFLRGPLRDWAEALLDDRRLRTEGYFNSAIVKKTWSLHLKGQGDYAQRLWPILMFQAWHEHWRQA